MLGVLGPNGAGKTTAVRILATLLKADEGTAIVAGHDVAAEPAKVREQIGLTGQYASVDELLTGRQNLELIGALLDLKRKDAKPRAQELLEWFDLADAGDRPAQHLLRRHAPPPRPRGQPRRPPEHRLPRRAHDRPRPRQARGHVGRRAQPRPRRLDDPADHAVPRRGRRAGRRDQRDRPRPGHRPRHADRPQADRRRPDADRPPERPGPLEETANIIAELGTRCPVFPARGTVAVPVAGDEALATAIYRLNEAGIAVTELSLHLPSPSTRCSSTSRPSPRRR